MKKVLHKLGKWADDRGGFSELMKPLKTHLVPPGSAWNYVWGSATLFCLIIQVVTGIALSFLYQPSADVAYTSLQYIENQAFLGSFIRGLHNWGASGMVFLMGMHMIRVYIFAAYKYPREMSWITGVFLMAITIVMAFTGQLLRWDNNGVWSAVVAAEQMGRIPIIGDSIAYFLLGGSTIGGETLNRFFAMHVFLFPAILFMLVGYHLFLVFRNGISEPPKIGRLVDPKTYRTWYENMLQKKGVPFFPDAIWRDAVFSALVLIILVALAWFVGAPALTSPPDLTNVNADPKPDWYFTWIFALFALMPRQIESYVIFFGPLIGGTLLFAIPFLSNKGERSPLRRPWAIAGVSFIILSICSLWYIGIRAPWSPHFDAEPLSEYTSVPQATEEQEKGIEYFNTVGCLYCHKINSHGGIRGPELTQVQNRLTREQIIIRIVNGAENMPAYGGALSKEELSALVSFLMAEDKSGAKPLSE
ncbi:MULTISPECIES: cytochrome b N-terminal domain-containing protein [unclassified Leeuwenhoekiella]|uniref:cytochrome b N-terminal domain-containing protein n=1 Tax=unclassified Leeuwenhoekiella TaxID=2615029 RepID=UPI000C62818B|nr:MULTISPECIES: cytochrome b N-terminal domain-containing protein [unclassified Leeuwenhoekiella]MAW95458.1 cytochrome B6 [Leeuwenhoekiella sp.]MBA80845.1 cytochrome B6 [Leeuwenhoekiella sp.]